MEEAFTRHRYEFTFLAALMAVAVIELVVVHLLVALWSAPAAWLLSALTLLFLAHFAVLMDGMRRRPHLIGERQVTVRHGGRGEISIPIERIAGADDVSFRAEERGPEVFRATLMAHPNVALRLAEPIDHGKRRLRHILVRADEPALFRAALATRLAERDAA